ncbi:uncharacterized protein LACBIDRAFT_294785 [Laccaria bicolor S238N-H82]|uniref:Predicted protein n=1 Tax=Laccaria bicolor (strain S238N-H82 / ATCC MYA-4686) TaxID=486041 RepID=B0DI76_LACBS|nr:uncharacterized protein LACBIDRAFT_294785 [Laccaria bicolor S238N-H82]EDR05631.1 predicted protein [Laccaria bicolor S238N-H82]|eukprot:XP_001883735.1 predicted protein [Laccaria bicolor S238N-H82]
MSFPRPVTSKSRGICKYYNSPRGCFSGDSCKFLHGEEPGQNVQPLLTPYDQAKQCRYYQHGFCKRGELCWFKHVDPHQTNILEEEDQLCSVCFEKPVTFGLLGKPGDVVESGNTKKCPMCRTASRFITPSSKFCIAGEKADAIKAYQASMGRVTCRYFQTSQAKNKNKPLCPFGKDCFYKHVNEDGTPFLFREGVDVSMRRYRVANGMEDNDFLPSFFPLPLDIDSLSLFGTEGVNLAMNRLNFSAPRNRQRRTVERLRRLNVGIQDSELPTTAGRLREVGRSLEMLNNAIQEGATLETLNVAVEALRMGLTRLERGGSRGGLFRRNSAEDAAIERDAEEDDVMERLETLADQMLASINFLRENAETDEAHSDSPPPLEPINETFTIETRPPRLTPDEGLFGVERDFGGSESSDDSMPDLRSVSNSSDSDYDESDEDVEETHDTNSGTSFLPHDLMFDIAGSLRTEEATARHGGRSSSRTLNRDPQRTVIQDGGTGRFSTVVDREEQRDVNTDIEDDEGSNDEEVAATIVPPTTVSMPEPPFVTDGRGRVVWTSPRENGSNDESNESIVPREIPSGQRAKVAGEFTGDVRGRVIGTSSEGQASEETTVNGRDTDSPRRSLLGRMFDAFF